MAYFRKTPQGKWRAEVVANGSRKSSVWETKAQAKDWAARTELALKAAKPAATRTFDQAVNRYIEEVVPRKAGKQWELRRLEVMRGFFGDVLLADLDSPNMAAWRDWRLKGGQDRRPVSASTVVREANLLKHLLHTARDEWRWMEHDPFRGVRMPAENPARTAMWSWQQVRQVLRAGQRSGGKTLEVTQAFHIALRTGMRLQEVLAAPAGFDPRRRVVLVKTKTHPAGDVVPIGRIAAKLLQRARFTVGPNEASTLFARLTRQLMIDGLTFHDTRATALTLLAKKVDVMTLAKISRHRDISLLHRVYYRETPEEIAARL